MQSSQWATHLEDAAEFGQTRGLFLLPGGRPLLLEGSGSGTGSAGGANSSGGGKSSEGCGACGSGAGATGVGSNAGGTRTGSWTATGIGPQLSSSRSEGNEKGNSWPSLKRCGAKSDAGSRPSNS